ncbi:MAG: M56 family metallopeptidase [Actinomycetota bacterium]|nr:M56 family metallopeptidase [Actinomycetota bacterium]
MILAICLLLVAGSGLLAGPWLLRRVAATQTSPLAGIAAWQIASWSVFFGAALAVAIVASPSVVSIGHLPQGLESCVVVLRHVPAQQASVLKLPAAVLLVGALTRLATSALRTALDDRRQRARHRAMLSVVGRIEPVMGVSVLEDATPVVYCVPGHGGTVVFTSSALELLTDAQRVAVLAHERAHLRGRHHLVLVWGSLLAQAFPRVRLFRDARENTSRLIEMRADDVAASGCGRHSIVEALFALAGKGTPSMALGASGIETVQRVERLLATADSRQQSALTRLRRVAVGAGMYSLIAVSPGVLAIVSHAALCLD